jgi:hypothetical protein
MKFLKFFPLFWFIFALLDPDPDSEYGSGSTDPIESGSNWDPDLQPCFFQCSCGSGYGFCWVQINFFLRQFRNRSQSPPFQKNKYFLVENAPFVILMNDPVPGPGAKAFGNDGSGSVIMNLYCMYW